MPKTCDACGKELAEESIHHGELPENGAVSDEKYAEVVANFNRVLTDLNFRERYGLEARIKKVSAWFKFHGPWMPSLPPLKHPEDMRTENIYQYVRDLCDYMASNRFADEIHVEACSANRELSREIVRMNMRL